MLAYIYSRWCSLCGKGRLGNCIGFVLYLLLLLILIPYLKPLQYIFLFPKALGLIHFMPDGLIMVIFWGLFYLCEVYILFRSSYRVQALLLTLLLPLLVLFAVNPVFHYCYGLKPEYPQDANEIKLNKLTRHEKDLLMLTSERFDYNDPNQFTHLSWLRQLECEEKTDQVYALQKIVQSDFHEYTYVRSHEMKK